LFGANALAFSSEASIPMFQKGAFLLNVFHWPHLALVFILSVLSLASFLLFFQKLRFGFAFVLNLLIWLLVMNLHHKIYPSLTGGNFLLNQFLFFNCFLSFPYTTSSDPRTDLKKVVHNFAVLAIIIQICLTYFLSALAKLNDEAWMSGTAIESILQVNHYYLYSDLFIFPSFLTQILTYSILFYQLFFPFILFLKKIKKPFLILGIVMHLYIAFVMGLVDFGLVMILGYVYFWPVKGSNK
jgi:hypothetical protein